MFQRNRYGKMKVVNRDDILAILRLHEADLRQYGVERLSLFGSMARGAETPASDIDLLAKYEDGRRVSLLQISGLQLLLEQMFNRPVDLAEEGMLRPTVAQNVEREAIRAF